MKAKAFYKAFFAKKLMKVGFKQVNVNPVNLFVY
jgi:hypothetical protein